MQLGRTSFRALFTGVGAAIDGIAGLAAAPGIDFSTAGHALPRAVLRMNIAAAPVTETIR